MKNILVPIDFSPVSKNALRYAIDLACFYQSKITLFHAYTPAMIEPYMAVYMQEALKNQQEEVAINYFAEIEHEVPVEQRREIQMEFKISMGPAVEEIISVSKEIGSDLIIIGMRGGNILIRKIMGSTTAALLQRSVCPVMVIPQGKKFGVFQHIAYATNYDEGDLSVIDKLLDFAHTYNATIHCIHIKQDESAHDMYRSAILKKAYQFDISGDKLLFDIMKHSNVIKGIELYTKSNDIDLLVMLTHKRSVLGQLMKKSYTEMASHFIHIPLMAFQTQKVQSEYNEHIQ